MSEHDKNILEERAKLQSVRPTDVTNESDLLPAVAFVLHPEVYAIEYTYMKEVLTMKNLAPLPGTPDYVMGIVNYRGEVVSALNLKKLFGLREMGLTEFNKLLIVSDGAMSIGIVADAIQGNTMINTGTLSKPPMTVSETAVEFFSGVTPGGLILLDAGKMLKSAKIIVDQ